MNADIAPNDIGPHTGDRMRSVAAQIVYRVRRVEQDEHEYGRDDPRPPVASEDVTRYRYHDEHADDEDDRTRAISTIPRPICTSPLRNRRSRSAIASR